MHARACFSHPTGYNGKPCQRTQVNLSCITGGKNTQQKNLPSRGDFSSAFLSSSASITSSVKGRENSKVQLQVYHIPALKPPELDAAGICASCHQAYPIAPPRYKKSVEEGMAQSTVCLTRVPLAQGEEAGHTPGRLWHFLHDCPLHNQPPAPVSLPSYHQQGTSGDQKPSFRPRQDCKPEEAVPSHVGDTEKCM